MEGQNQTSLDERISYRESPAFAVAEGLRERGYEIADSAGIRQEEPAHHVIGILRDRTPVQRSFLGVKWNKNQRASYLGTLWFECPGAKQDENWILDVYGREHVPELTAVVKQLSEPHQVKVQVRLKSESERAEAYLFDFDV